MRLLRILPIVLALTAGAAWAQAPGVAGKPLMRAALSGDDTKDTLMLSIEFAPGATTGRHTHPGDEYAVVLEGTLELRLEGQPAKRVSAGQAYHNPRGVVHETVNVGQGIARTVATFVLEKGKPTTTPAP